MKKLILSLALILAVSQSFGQRKSKEEPPNPQVDSLNLVVKNLTLQLDSVSLELIKYVGVYEAIKEKVIHYNFDPARASFLIDSLKVTRDSATAVLLAVPKPVPSDSIAVLLKENKMLKAENDSIISAWEKSRTAVPSEEIERAYALSGLKQLKELLDAKIITDTEFVTLKKKYLDKL